MKVSPDGSINIRAPGLSPGASAEVIVLLEDAEPVAQKSQLSAKMVIEVDIPVSFPRDQKDAKFLACALAAQADYFITEDKDFTDAMKLVSTKILSASRFKKLLIDTEGK